MSTIFTRLTEKEEQAAHNWQTVRLNTNPAAHSRLAQVADIIQQQFLSKQWEHWIGDGSITFQRGPRVVRVWIDDANRLARHFGLNLTSEPIVVGIDLTDHDPVERHAILEFLRSRFSYVDPEKGERPIVQGLARKICLVPDFNHWPDVVFIPEGRPCDFPMDEANYKAILVAIAIGERTWTNEASPQIDV
jgi:hypothetical protein